MASSDQPKRNTMKNLYTAAWITRSLICTLFMIPTTSLHIPVPHEAKQGDVLYSMHHRPGQNYKLTSRVWNTPSYSTLNRCFSVSRDGQLFITGNITEYAGATIHLRVQTTHGNRQKNTEFRLTIPGPLRIVDTQGHVKKSSGGRDKRAALETRIFVLPRNATGNLFTIASVPEIAKETYEFKEAVNGLSLNGTTGMVTVSEQDWHGEKDEVILHFRVTRNEQQSGEFKNVVDKSITSVFFQQYLILFKTFLK